MVKLDPLNTIVSRIDAYHANNQGEPRPHLGASIVGAPCKRQTWLKFRWALIEQFEGRMLRLFRRGQNEETTVCEDLRAAGITVEYSVLDGEQSRVTFGSHVSGSLDGIVTGVPEAPKAPHVLEIKTHNERSFKELKSNGVEKSKPQHWTQMQLYMLGTKTERALYFAVNKNDDHIYTERVKLEKERALQILDDAKALALSQRIPEPISANPSFYRCKWCAAHAFCHEQIQMAPKNCRTCHFAIPTADSTWQCAKWQSEIPLDAQRVGCEEYIIHDDLRGEC